MAKVLLSAKMGAPYMEISVGYGLFAKYRMVFVNERGSTLWTKTGHSVDGVVDKIMVGVPIEELTGGTISWKIVVATFDDGEQPFYAELKFTQDNVAVPNGSFVYKGKIDVVRKVSDGSGIEVHE
ncbi:MAG: hypothetical protein SFU56_07480 [Capsulimonadales bacterium]|nr:hypothetical protein [Capsulimonadales bacterium]